MIRNITTQKMIVENHRLADFPLSRSLGLMFTRPRPEALILKCDKEEIIHLHMFFVFYSIDVIFVDNNNLVVDVKQGFKPFHIYEPKAKALYAIELPQNTIKESETKVGDKIEMEGR